VSTTSNPSWLGADPPLVCLAGAAPGLLWGLRHLPVIDHLGVHPHGVDWAPVAAAFIAAVAVLDPACGRRRIAASRKTGWRLAVMTSRRCRNILGTVPRCATERGREIHGDHGAADRQQGCGSAR
jgi:hypothetical protein